MTRLKPLTQGSTDNTGCGSCSLQVPTPSTLPHGVRKKHLLEWKGGQQSLRRAERVTVNPTILNLIFQVKEVWIFYSRADSHPLFQAEGRKHWRTFPPSRMVKKSVQIFHLADHSTHSIQHYIQLSDTQDGSVNVLGTSICYMAASDCGKLRSE